MKQLTRDQLLRIHAIWQARFNQSSLPNGGMAEAWHGVITDFLLYEGYDLVSPGLISLEQTVLEKGRAADYIGALTAVVGVHGEVSDPKNLLILLLGATASEREKAARFVL